MRHVFLFSIIFILGSALAETLSLPLTLQGQGNQTTVHFSSDTVWTADVTSNQVAVVYIYDADTGAYVHTVRTGEPIAAKGTFVMKVYGEGSWQLKLYSTPNAALPETVTVASAEPVVSSPDISLLTTASVKVNLPLKRLGFGQSRFYREALTSDNTACEPYQNNLEAQNAFVELGGPVRDPSGLDPDGDGYACDYSPFESYESSSMCQDDRVFRNPRFRNKDALYIEGRCVKKTS